MSLTLQGSWKHKDISSAIPQIQETFRIFVFFEYNWQMRIVQKNLWAFWGKVDDKFFSLLTPILLIGREMAEIAAWAQPRLSFLDQNKVWVFVL